MMVWAATAIIDCCPPGLSEFNEIFIYIAAVVVLGYAVFRLASEVFQFTQQRLDYLFDWVNWTEVAMCILSGLFAWVFHTDCLCPTEWQWQAGTVAVFLAWINLIVFIRKLPLTGTGIYVVMFVDIFYTFCRMIFLSALLVIAFGLAFYMALFEPDIGVRLKEAIRLAALMYPLPPSPSLLPPPSFPFPPSPSLLPSLPPFLPPSLPPSLPSVADPLLHSSASASQDHDDDDGGV